MPAAFAAARAAAARAAAATRAGPGRGPISPAQAATASHIPPKFKQSERPRKFHLHGVASTVTVSDSAGLMTTVTVTAAARGPGVSPANGPVSAHWHNHCDGGQSARWSRS